MGMLKDAPKPPRLVISTDSVAGSPIDTAVLNKTEAQGCTNHHPAFTAGFSPAVTGPRADTSTNVLPPEGGKHSFKDGTLW